MNFHLNDKDKNNNEMSIREEQGMDIVISAKLDAKCNNVKSNFKHFRL